MTKIVKNIKLNPFEPNIEVFGDITLQAGVPSSDTSVTIQVNPNIIDHQSNADQGNTKIRQVTMTQPTAPNTTYEFDLSANKVQSITIENVTYDIELVNVGKKTIQEQDFNFYEFSVNLTSGGSLPPSDAAASQTT